MSSYEEYVWRCITGRGAQLCIAGKTSRATIDRAIRYQEIRNFLKSERTVSFI